MAEITLTQSTPLTPAITLYEKKINVLKTELVILKLIAGIQKSVRTSVYEKKWADFDSVQCALTEAAVKLEAVEKERVALFDGEDASFYAYTAALPCEQRTEITSLYRELKFEVAKMRISNTTFDKYLNESSAAVHDFLDAAFPDRRGKLYGRRGAVKKSDMRSIVLDKRL
jgi:hypothetical protein